MAASSRTPAEAISLLVCGLDPSLLSTRKGPRGSYLTYVRNDIVVELANFVFGHFGWSSEVKEKKTSIEKVSGSSTKVHCTAIVRVTVCFSGGTTAFRESNGLGLAELPNVDLSVEKAEKEAVTDAMKRALRLFGSALGNCVYDPDFLSWSTKPAVFRHRNPWRTGALFRGVDGNFETVGSKVKREHDSQHVSYDTENPGSARSPDEYDCCFDDCDEGALAELEF
jgi:DNA repair and recombination protein RAD52